MGVYSMLLGMWACIEGPCVREERAARTAFCGHFDTELARIDTKLVFQMARLVYCNFWTECEYFSVENAYPKFTVKSFR